MSPEFRAIVEQLHEKCERLMAADPYGKGMTLPVKGVYLFRENGVDLYVGRSNNIPRRYDNHRRGTVNQAAFAGLLAREELGIKRTYEPGAKVRASEPKFVEAFRKGKERVSAMEFRAVEENEQIRQALLEIYCAVTLGTRYNGFGTH